MTWVRLDDQFSIHRKIAGLSDSAYRLHVDALCWSARNLMDGIVAKTDLALIVPRMRTPYKYAAELVFKEVWHVGISKCDAPKCPDEIDIDGWRIHDYFAYQFSKEQVTRQREATRERVSRWRNGVSNGVTNGVSNGAPDPTRPVSTSVSTSANGWRPARDLKPAPSSPLNGAATRQPPPFAEAQDRALHPESSGRHARKDTP